MARPLAASWPELLVEIRDRFLGASRVWLGVSAAGASPPQNSQTGLINGFFRECCGGSAVATGVRRVRCADAGRHTGTERRPGAGFRLMRASGSGRPDPDARIDPPGPFWRRTCGNPAPAPARPGAIAAGNRDLTTKLTHEPDNVKDYRFVRDYPAKTGVRSSQSGIPSHCWRGCGRPPAQSPPHEEVS
jgi:hypothetical protein